MQSGDHKQANLSALTAQAISQILESSRKSTDCKHPKALSGERLEAAGHDRHRPGTPKAWCRMALRDSTRSWNVEMQRHLLEALVLQSRYTRDRGTAAGIQDQRDSTGQQISRTF